MFDLKLLQYFLYMIQVAEIITAKACHISIRFEDWNFSFYIMFEKAVLSADYNCDFE